MSVMASQYLAMEEALEVDVGTILGAARNLICTIMAYGP